MKWNKKKIIKSTAYSILGVGLLSAVVASSVINAATNTTNLFAEITVSDNTSVLADKSFSESTFDGYSQFLQSVGYTELDEPASFFKEGMGLWRRPGANNLEREITFKGIFSNGKKLVIAPGFNQAQAITNVLLDPRYNSNGFILLDSGIDTSLFPEGVRNLSTVVFRMEQAGFQAGVSASEFLSINEHIFGSNGLKIGGYVGLALDATMDFLVGFQKGMVAWNAANPTKTQVEWVKLGPNASNYASGSFGVGGGKAMAIDLIGKHADVIMPIAGPQTLDVVNEIIVSGKPAIVVGVDTAQENTESLKRLIPGLGDKKIKNADGTISENQNIIQFSAEKKLNVATSGILNAITWSNGAKDNIYDDPIAGISFYGFGYSNIIALGAGGSSAVGVSEAGKDYFTKGLVGEDYENKYEDAVNDLKTNVVFKELITEISNPTDNFIRLYDSFTGLPAGGGIVTGVTVRPYKDGIDNSFIDIAKPSGTRLDGSEWIEDKNISSKEVIWVKQDDK